jgi:predicted nuclease with TOPRIM domain
MMTRTDNTRYLTRAAAGRHQATLTKASHAIEHLDRSGQPVTFSAVAAAAGVSRTWLYRNPSIRDLITRLRGKPSQTASTPAARRSTAESLRARLDAARQEITRLRAENATLREQAARHLGQQRAQEHGTPPRSSP